MEVFMRIMHSAATAFAVAALVGCNQDTGPAAVAAPQLDQIEGESGPSASGHANWVNRMNEDVSLSFHGREKDGVVDGHFVQWVTSTAGVRRENVGTIDCLRIVGTQDAVLSGIVLENANPALVGAVQIFSVHDDGEGVDAVDRRSPLTFQAPAAGINCQNFTPAAATVTPLESGNIQVKP
jgi:hypothetical protein